MAGQEGGAYYDADAHTAYLQVLVSIIQEINGISS